MPYKSKSDHLASQRRWYRRNKQAIYARKLKRKDKKAGRPKPECCEICKTPSKRIVYDHCHQTEKFRGWLCHSCNIVLGHVKDDPNILWNLGAYLMRHKVYGDTRN